MSTWSGEYRLSRLIPLVDQDRAARRQVRQLERELDRLLDEHGTTLRDESGIGPIAAATLLPKSETPFRFARESKFARWCGTGAVALVSGEGDGRPLGEGKTRREARRAHKHTSPTASSDACGKTNNTAENTPLTLRLDKGASDSPRRGRPDRSPVPSVAVLHPRRHRPRHPRRAGINDPPLHPLAQPTRPRPSTHRPRQERKRCLPRH